MRVLGAHSRRGAAVAAVLAVSLTGVPAAIADEGQGDHGKRGSSEQKKPRRKATSKAVRPKVPVVVFVGIADNQVVGRRATFRVRLVNFTISPSQAPTKLVPGQGFLHFSMDGGALDVPGYSANAAWAVKAGTQGRYSPASTPFLGYANIPRGTHTLRVTLSDNFHAETGVTTVVTFVVR